MSGEERDQVWMEGNRAAAVSFLRTALNELGYDGTEAQHTKWILEREAVVVQLRNICRDYGDNDWPDNLHLADVIEKHLGRYLDEE